MRPDGSMPDPCPRAGVNDISVQVRASDLFALRSREHRFESCWGRSFLFSAKRVVTCADAEMSVITLGHDTSPDVVW
jgi:hypothetical protein